MFESAVKEYGTLTHYAEMERQEFQRSIEAETLEEEYEFEDINITEIKLNLIQKYISTYLELFKNNLETAVAFTGEYSKKGSFFKHLFEVISKNIEDILTATVTRNGLSGAYQVMKNVAGDMNDFIEGVQQAREYLEFDLSGSAEDRAKFWKEHVWPNDELYEQTISTRMSMWGELAPYWWLIEFGNQGKRGAYPTFGATKFFSQTIGDIIRDLETKTQLEIKDQERKLKEKEPQIDEKYDKKEITLFEDAQRRLLEDPTKYQPNYVFSEFKKMENQRWYEIYLTKMRKIGRRLIRRKIK